MEFWSITATPPRARFPTSDEVLAEAAQRDVDRAYRDLLTRRIEAAIARTDAMLRRRHANPAVCPDCGHRFSNGTFGERSHQPDPPVIERSAHRGAVLSVR